MSLRNVYVVCEWDDDDIVGVAFTEAERDRLMAASDERYWKQSYCYERVLPLAALPPSIVVDGKVVPLIDDDGLWAPWVDRRKVRDMGGAPAPSLEWLLDAAREVEV